MEGSKPGRVCFSRGREQPMQTHGSNPDANRLKHLIRLVITVNVILPFTGLGGGGTYENPEDQ